jgi:hypothetical protein
MVRLHYDATGFTSFEETCTDGLTGPWGIPAPEVHYDSGAVWFQSGSRTLVWSVPRGVTLDIAGRRIIGTVGLGQSPSYPYNFQYLNLVIYSLDTEQQLTSAPASGFLPFGTPVLYGANQILWANSVALLLIDLQ